jgi:hypothetical protein
LRTAANRSRSRAPSPGARGAAMSALTPRERVLVDAIAERVSGLLHSEPSCGRLVDAATIANALGVDRSYVYAHAGELGAVRLGGGSKPRLRFDLEAARKTMSRYASMRSQGSNASAGAKSVASPGRQSRRLPNRLPEPGLVLAVRPLARSAGRSRRPDRRGLR